MQYTVLYLGIFLLVSGSVYLLTSTLFKLNIQPPRPHIIEGIRNAAPAAATKKTYSPAKILKPLTVITRPFSKLRYLKNLQSQTEVLKIRLDIAMLILQKIFLGIIAGVLVFVLFKLPGYALAAALVGFFIPDLIILSKIKAKKEEIIKVFPETVDLLDMCINAGADFLSAIKWITEKSTSSAFIEQLEIVLHETRLGKSRTDALRDMAKRLNLVDVNSFIRTIVQSERMGTSIEEACRTLSEDTRDRRFQAGERYAIKASLKILFPLLFFILPAIIIVVAGPIVIQFTQGGLVPTGAGF